MTADSIAPHPSVDSIGPQVGRLIERHIDRVFRRLQGPRVEIESHCVRLVTEEPHPFGNFALIADPLDAKEASATLEPLCRVSARPPRSLSARFLRKSKRSSIHAGLPGTDTSRPWPLILNA